MTDATDVCLGVSKREIVTECVAYKQKDYIHVAMVTAEVTVVIKGYGSGGKRAHKLPLVLRFPAHFAHFVNGKRSSISHFDHRCARGRRWGRSKK